MKNILTVGKNIDIMIWRANFTQCFCVQKAKA